MCTHLEFPDVGEPLQNVREHERVRGVLVLHVLVQRRRVHLLRLHDARFILQKVVT